MVHLENGTVDSIYSQSKKRVIVEIKMCTFFPPSPVLDVLSFDIPDYRHYLKENLQGTG